MRLTAYTEELLVHHKRCLEEQLCETALRIAELKRLLQNAEIRKANLQRERDAIMEDLDGR